MPAIHFRLDCIPPTVTHHSKKRVTFVKNGRIINSLGDTDELIVAKSTLDSLLLPHRKGAALTGPLRMKIEWVFPWLASHSAKKRKAGRIWHTSKSDLDNLSKTLTDRLAVLRFIENDQSVVELQLRKWWGDTPGIEIWIEQIGEVAIPAPSRLE